MSDLKIGFIGYFRHAQANLIPTIKLLNYEISAIATAVEESAVKAQKDFREATIYSDYKAMLSNEKLDCVIICTSPRKHATIAKDALNAGLNVFVEKPLGFTVNEASEIDLLAKSVGKNVMVGFMKRFAPIYNQAKAIQNNPEFGKTVSVFQTICCRNITPDPAEFLLMATIHQIDLLRFFLDEISEVKGTATTIETTSSYSFSLKTVSGQTASLYFSASPAWEKSTQEMRITGTNGYLKILNTDELTYHKVSDKIEIPRWQTIEEKEIKFTPMYTTTSGGNQHYYLHGFAGELKYFFENCMGQIVINNSEENLKTMELFEKLVASIK